MKTVTLKEVEELLLAKGYKLDEPSFYVDKSYYKRIKGSDCLCNERPPMLVVEISDFEEHTSMSIKLRAEASNHQWVDVGYYALPISEIAEIDTYEYIISKMWECAN